MKAEQLFNELSKSIKDIASGADLIMFEGPIKKSDKDELFESCLTCACFYMANYGERPPFLLDFIERDNSKEKLSSSERKALGAYFTPAYIAEYIVKQTIGPLVDKITLSKKNSSVTKIKKICDLKICDPSMGGGIFLVCAHDYLMERLMEIDQDKFEISDLASMSLRAVFGVDINPKAVEFSKMVLNLNVAKWKSVSKLDEFVLSVQ